MTKVGRNSSCPCGRKQKYKHCCEGVVDWERLHRGPSSEFRRHLSIRGRNLHFLIDVLNILDFDPERTSHVDFKRRFTADNVRNIYERVLAYWPPDTQLKAMLRDEERKTVSGLYTGMYDPDLLARAVSRHAMYSERLLLADPLPYPLSMKPEYSPLVHPEQYRTATLRYVRLMLSLFPWIERDIVWFVRPPSEFSHELKWNLLKAQETFSNAVPGMQQLLESQLTEFKESDCEKDFKRLSLLLSMPDRSLRQRIKETSPEISEEDIEKAIRHIHQERDEHPYFIEPYGPDNPGELHFVTSGMSYLESRLTAGLTGSHLVTDMPTRWREIEFDREQARIDDGKWSPIAKAVSKLEMKTLNKADLDFALKLRDDGLLIEFRQFLRRLWTDLDPDKEFDDALAVDLEAQLAEEVNKARDEWDNIGKVLLRRGGTSALTGAGLLANGQVSMALAAVGKAAIDVGVAVWDRASFRFRHPASVFLDLEKHRSNE